MYNSWINVFCVKQRWDNSQFITKLPHPPIHFWPIFLLFGLGNFTEALFWWVKFADCWQLCLERCVTKNFLYFLFFSLPDNVRFCTSDFPARKASMGHMCQLDHQNKVFSTDTLAVLRLGVKWSVTLYPFFLKQMTGNTVCTPQHRTPGGWDRHEKQIKRRMNQRRSNSLYCGIHRNSQIERPVNVPVLINFLNEVRQKKGIRFSLFSVQISARARLPNLNSVNF